MNLSDIIMLLGMAEPISYDNPRIMGHIILHDM